MPKTIDIRDLPARLEEVLDLATSGGEVILTDGATPRGADRPTYGSPHAGPGSP